MIRKISQLGVWVAVLVLIPALVLAAPIGRISHLEGEADLTRVGQKAVLIKVNDPVNAGDILRTKAKTKVEVTFNDGNTLWLAEKTYLKITQYQNREGRKSFFDLFRGKTRAVVNTLAKRSSLELRTPTAVSGVRGTIIIGYFANGLSGFAFERGQGYGYNRRTPGRVVTIRTGEVMQVASPTAQPVVRPATANEIEQHLQDTSATETQGEGPAQEEPQGEGTPGQDQGEGQGQDQGQPGQDQGQPGQEQGEDQGGDQGGTQDQGAPPGGPEGSGQPSGDGNIPDTSAPPPPPSDTPPPPPPPPTQTTIIETPPPTLPTGPTETFTTLTQAVTLGDQAGDLAGTLTASISDTTNTGTLELTGTGTARAYVLPIAEGTLSDGSTYDAYLAGIPGSWRGLFTGISNKGGALSLLKGSLDGTYIPPNGAAGSVTASGSIVRQSGYSSLEPTMGIGTLSGLSLPVINSVSVGGSIELVYPEFPAVSGYQTTTGGLLGIWGVRTTGGSFDSNTEIGTSWTTQIGDFSGYDAFLGDITITDDLKGHVSISGNDSILYMDPYYYGLMSMNYRGVYDDSTFTYDSIGTGTYKLVPLKYSGYWGAPGAPIVGTLYTNAGGLMTPSGEDYALIGGLTQAPWIGPTDFKAIGSYTASGDATYALWNTQLGGSDTPSGTGYFEGITAGIWGSSRPGSIRAIYITPGINNTSTTGILTSDNIPVTPYAGLGMWTAAGTLGPYSNLTYAGNPTNWDIYNSTFAGGMLKGAFTSPAPSYLSANAFSLTTQYLVENSSYTSPPWGIYNFKLDGGYNEFSGKPAGDAAWSADLGGQAQYGQFGYGGSSEYWLAHVSGTNAIWTTDGQITGTVSGSYLTRTHLGTLSGPFYGLCDESYSGAGYGGWIGQSIGTYQGTPLTFVSDISASISHTVRNYDGRYAYSSGGSYYYEYSSDSYGYSYDQPTSNSYPYTQTEYYSDGTTYTWGYDALGKYISSSGTWDPTQSLAFLATQPEGASLNYAYSHITTNDSGYMYGLMGGTGSLWTGSDIPFKAIGNDSHDGESIWGSGIYSYNYLNDTNTTYDGGAYAGVMGGTEINNGLEGKFLGLYIAPDQSAGYLEGPLSGTLYPGIGMFEMAGTLNRTQPSVSHAPGIAPEELYDSIWYGNFNAMLAGQFTGGGSIDNLDSYGYGGYGGTMSIVNWGTNVAENWGIYRMLLIGGFTNSATSSWSAKVGGDASFGAYYDSSDGLNDDYGYWLADINNGALASGKLSGTLTNGRFITPFKLGTLSGDLLGSLNSGQNLWEAVSMGKWEGTPLAFGGETYGSLMYRYSGDGSYLRTGGYASGLLGGTAGTLFSGTDTPVLMMGRYDDYYGDSIPYLMYGSGWYFSGSTIHGGSEGGTFDGYLVGLWANKAIKAKMLSLYYTEIGGAGETGYLESTGTGAFNLAGNYYPGVGIWEIPDGTLKAIPSVDTISSTDIAYHYFDGNKGLGAFTAGGTLTVTTIAGDPMRFSELDWGIWNAGFGGTYSGTTGADWAVNTGGVFRNTTWDGYGGYTETGYWLGTLTGTAWGATEIDGTFLGTALTNLAHYELTGDVIGSPVAGNNWQAAGIGTYTKEDIYLNGLWGMGTCLFANDGGHALWVGYDTGRIGVTADNNTLYAMGAFHENWRPVGDNRYVGGGSHLWNSPLSGGDVDTGNILFDFNGFTGGIWKDGLLKGNALAIYRNPMDGDAGFLYTAVSAAAPFGLTGDYFNTYVYEGTGGGYGGYEEGFWNATGTLASVSMPVPKGFAASSYNFASDGRMANAKLSGKFDNSGHPSPISGFGGAESGTLTFLRKASVPYDPLPWGVYNLKLFGDEVAANTFSEKPDGTADWSALAGGEIAYAGYGGGYGGFDGRWLATVKGAWTADGEISGSVGAMEGAAGTFGRFLTDTTYGTLTGPFTGVNSYSYGTSGTWIGQSIGTYQGQQTLAFSSELIDGSLYQVVPGTFVGAEYLQPNYESSGGPNPWFEPLSYEIDYFVPDGRTYDATRMIAYEDVEVKGVGYGYDDEYQYLPFGKWILMKYGMGVTHPAGFGSTPPDLDWSNPSKWPHFAGTVVTDPAVRFPGNGHYVKAIDWEWDLNALVRNGAFTGLLGGLPGQSLWTSDSGQRTDFVMMGSHDAYTGSQLFGSMISYDGSASANGAYIGALTGIIQDADPADAYGENHLEGLIAGIYVDPDGKAGILKGDVAGTSYQRINMWEAPEGSATLYRYAASLASGLSASSLADNLFVGIIGAGVNSGIHGTFGGAGSIDSPMGIMGRTFSIRPDWGVFSLQVGMDNTLTPSGGTSEWTATAFGSGIFGKYSLGEYNYADWGYWYANLASGTQAGGKLTGNLGGSVFFTDSAFVTHMKVGTLEGSLLGTYDSSGSTPWTWQATAAGSYVKTKDVLFSSEIQGNSYTLALQNMGALSYADGSVYNYWYTSSEEYGNSVYYNKTANTETITRMGTEGPPDGEVAHKEVWVHHLTDDTWTYATAKYGALTDLRNDAPVGGSWMYGPATQWNFWDSDFNGILAGVDNLWENLGTATPTHLYLMGDIDTFDGKALKLFSGTAVSFDPLVSLDPYNYWWDPALNGGYGGYTGGSQSPIGGAYYGFLGGTVNNANVLSGFFRALYMDEGRNVGIVFTDAALDGSFDSAIGMWKAEGDVYTYPLFTAAVIGGNFTPATFAGNLNRGEDRMGLSIPIWEDGHVSGDGVALSASAETGISLPLTLPPPVPAYPTFLSLNSTLMGGILNGSAPPSSWTWTVPPGGPIYNESSHVYNPVRTNFISVDIASETVYNTFAGSMVSASIEWGSAMTTLSGGQIKGSFDPNATWQAVISATGMDTATFMSKMADMTSDEQRTAFYKATRIPSFQVGATDLRGNGDARVSGGTINLGSATDASRGILKATFFAPSTNAKPQVWASGEVKGSYTGSPAGGSVELSGYAPNSTGQATNGIVATFNVLPFGTTTWGATITNGSAPANSLTAPAPAGGAATHDAIGFHGGAAGMITDPGTFTGTAAGIVTPVIVTPVIGD